MKLQTVLLSLLVVATTRTAFGQVSINHLDGPDIAYDYNLNPPPGVNTKCALINVAMDESGSMENEQTFLQQKALPDIIWTLYGAQYQYDHVFVCSNGFGFWDPSFNDWHDYRFLGCSRGLPTGALTNSTIVTEWINYGGWEEGYYAMTKAMDNVNRYIDGYDLNMDCGQLHRNMILVSDEDRDSAYVFNRTVPEMRADLADRGYILNVIVDATIAGDRNNVGIKISTNSAGTHDNTIFRANGVGGYTTYQRNNEYYPNFVRNEYLYAVDVNKHYLPLIIDTPGATWNINSLRDNNAVLVDSFTQAFVEIKVQEIASITPSPTLTPTSGPTSRPTNGPTSGPTHAPSSGPTSDPTSGPTGGPTSIPTSGPSSGPTSLPTSGPSSGPTSLPTSGPSSGPTTGPSGGPTSVPTSGPSSGPTSLPTSGPTSIPTSGPSGGPTSIPTSGPTSIPTSGPSGGPTSIPTSGPSSGPTSLPTSGPTSIPTSGPSGGPTSVPTSGPSSGPTSRPTSGPTSFPTSGPSSGPTSAPTVSCRDSDCEAAGPAYYSSECGSSYCLEGQCTNETLPGADCTIDIPEHLSGNPCYVGPKCSLDGLSCDHTFESEGTSCVVPGEDPSSFDAVCVDDPVCTPVSNLFVAGYMECIRPVKVGDSCTLPEDPLSAPTSRGVCHGGDFCTELGKCEPTAVPSTTVCREAEGCCDEEEYCPGDVASGFDCPEDLIKAEGSECRSACENCLGDQVEVCDGLSKSCANDIVFADELCILAGQHNNVGYLSIEITIDSDGNYILDIEFIDMDPLADGGENVKIYVGLEPPPSSPGSYNIKGSDIDSVVHNLSTLLDGYSPCDDSNGFYIAVHFDMADGETAWALPCDEKTSFMDEMASGFCTTNKKNGKQRCSGWGKYFNVAPCCPSEAGCADTCPSESDSSNNNIFSVGTGFLRGRH